MLRLTAPQLTRSMPPLKRVYPEKPTLVSTHAIAHAGHDFRAIRVTAPREAARAEAPHGLIQRKKDGKSFMERLGYHSGAFEPKDVAPDEIGPHLDLKTTNAYHRKKLESALRASKQAYLDEGTSSQSEDEVEKLVHARSAGGGDPDAVAKAVKARRRDYKASQLAAIARTFFPLSAEERTFQTELAQKRARDNEKNKGQVQMYGQDTREYFARVGEQFKQTSLYHNPYLRRAFRSAITKDEVENGGSKKYDQMQGKIRKELLTQLQADHAKMQWKEADFPDQKTWKAVEFMLKYPISNAGTGDSFHTRVEAGTDVTGSNPKVAFHHVAWKEAMSGVFSSFALTPTNLTALNDLRELMNPKKLKALQAKGLPEPDVGAHDKIGHQMTGFTAAQKGKFNRSVGGGQFKDIDLEAVRYVLMPLLKPRTRKGALYDPGTIAPSPHAPALVKARLTGSGKKAVAPTGIFAHLDRAAQVARRLAADNPFVDDYIADFGSDVHTQLQSQQKGEKRKTKKAAGKQQPIPNNRFAHFYSDDEEVTGPKPVVKKLHTYLGQ